MQSFFVFLSQTGQNKKSCVIAFSLSSRVKHKIELDEGIHPISSTNVNIETQCLLNKKSLA